MVVGQHVFESYVLGGLTPLNFLDLCLLSSFDLCPDLLRVLDPLFERVLRHLCLFLADPLFVHRQRFQLGAEAMALLDGRPDPVMDPQVAIGPLLLWLM